MNRVVLNKEEARQFARTVIRTLYTMSAAAQVDPEIMKRTTYKTLTSLLDQAKEVDGILVHKANVEDAKFEVYFSQKQKTVLRACFDGVIQVLKDKIIPEYQRRDPVPEKQLGEAQAKLETLKRTVRKLR